MPSAVSSRLRSPRGYVLLTVLVLAVVAGLVAATLATSSGSSRLAAMHTDLGDRAHAIAEAGMAHAIEYAYGVGGRDFDEVLDPELDTSCGSLPGSQPIPDHNDLVPRASAGFTRVTDAALGPQAYGRASFGGGAYFIRFDDDDDDLVATERWRKNTGNNELEGDFDCVEGARPEDTLTGNHAGGRHNPVRDRNAAIWVTVVGIYPGEDPARAKHRAVVRRYLTNMAGGGGSHAGIKVKGNIRVLGNSDLGMCSPIGHLEIDGDAEHVGGASDGCACGDSLADSWSNRWQHCTSGASFTDCSDTVSLGAVGTYPLPGCASGEIDTPGPTPLTVPAIDSQADELVDFSRSCVFFLDHETTGAKPAVWVWDAERTVDGVPCKSFEGSGGGNPWSPKPDGGFPFACWTPLVAQVGTSGAEPQWRDGPGAPVSEWSGGKWYPSQRAATATDVAMNNFLAANGVAAFPASAPGPFHKPDWSSCHINYPPFADSPTRYDCGRVTSDGSPGCDGSHVAMQWISSKSFLWFKPSNNQEAVAVPTGVYYFDGSVARDGAPVEWHEDSFPTRHGSGDPMDDYVLATIATRGDIRLQQEYYHFGAGQNAECDVSLSTCDPRFRMPALIANGDIGMRGGGSAAIGGTIISRGNVEYEGNGKLLFFGQLFSEGNFDVGGGGTAYWLYRVPLSEPDLPPAIAALPTQSPSTQ